MGHVRTGGATRSPQHVLVGILAMVVFFTLLAPLAAMLRLAGRDRLRLRRRHVRTYWVEVGHTRAQADFRRQG